MNENKINQVVVCAGCGTRFERGILGACPMCGWDAVLLDEEPEERPVDRLSKLARETLEKLIEQQADERREMFKLLLDFARELAPLDQRAAELVAQVEGNMAIRDWTGVPPPFNLPEPMMDDMV